MHLRHIRQVVPLAFYYTDDVPLATLWEPEVDRGLVFTQESLLLLAIDISVQLNKISIVSILLPKSIYSFNSLEGTEDTLSEVELMRNVINRF